MTEISHVVLVQWSQAATPDARSEIARQLLAFPAGIPGIVSVVEGVSASPEQLERGFEYGFIVRFESADARDAYLPHPVHVELADLIGANAENVLVFDIAA
ncbi:Dabb family protein [Marisediminicola senii]|uniref:Dabb family protein n=1 Tax=Marisediminicola senii TaxID=2711233 RepID=UPI0013ED6EFE|nr:Dabb family protein [Marisediminicola senii]